MYKDESYELQHRFIPWLNVAIILYKNLLSFTKAS